MLSFMSKWLTTMAASEGVGLKHEHDTITMSTCTQALGVNVQKRGCTGSSHYPPCWHYGHQQGLNMEFTHISNNLRGPHDGSQQATACVATTLHGFVRSAVTGCWVMHATRHRPAP